MGCLDPVQRLLEHVGWQVRGAAVAVCNATPIYDAVVQKELNCNAMVPHFPNKREQTESLPAPVQHTLHKTEIPSDAGSGRYNVIKHIEYAPRMS